MSVLDLPVVDPRSCSVVMLPRAIHACILTGFSYLKIETLQVGQMPSQDTIVWITNRNFNVMDTRVMHVISPWPCMYHVSQHPKTVNISQFCGMDKFVMLDISLLLFAKWLPQDILHVNLDYSVSRRWIHRPRRKCSYEPHQDQVLGYFMWTLK